MEERIVEFTEVLRQNGLKVAISETRDALEALAVIGLGDRDQVRATLKATLCKRTQDTPIFDHVFELFFARAAQPLEQIVASLKAQLNADDLRRLQSAELSPLSLAVLEGDRAWLASIFARAMQQLDLTRIQNALQTGFFSRRLFVAAGGEAMRGELGGKGRGLSDRGEQLVEVAMRSVEDAARGEIQRQSGARLRAGNAGPGDKSLNALTRQEVHLAEQSVRALAEKLKARLARRQRSKRKGQLNPRLTLRKNLTSGGVPMVPQFRSLRPRRPEVMVLCDVSDSVRNASKLMLLFAWSLQSLFSRVRSFIFVSELGEVTKYFEGKEPRVAIEAALAGDVISLTSSSNYGHSLQTFATHFLGSVTRRTTVVVIGDGRNNRNPAQVSALEDIKRKARQVIWVCTEPESNWGSGDSEMLAYARAVSQVVTVLNVRDLERLALQLVPQR